MFLGEVSLVENADYARASGTHWAVEPFADGSVALRNLGSFENPQFEYLNTDTEAGSVNMASSETHWEIVTLVPASAGAAATRLLIRCYAP